MALRVRGAEKKIAALQRLHQRLVIVRKRLRQALVVVEVLDDVGVVEVDDRRDLLAMGEELVADVALHDGDVVRRGQFAETFRHDRRGNQRDLVPVGAQHARHLQKADADAGGLLVPEGLGADQQRARHSRPFIRSTMLCSFQVREL